MRTLALVLALFLCATSLFADDVLGVKIVDTGPIPLSGLSHFVWQNNSGGWLLIKRVQIFTNGGNGATWILRRTTGDVVAITTNPQGEMMDFGTEWMQLDPGEFLDVYVQAQHADVIIWVIWVTGNTPTP